MLSWAQCGFLWVIVLAIFCIPLIKLVAARMMVSYYGAFLVVFFSFFNSINNGSNSATQGSLEIYGFPFNYYDSRPVDNRKPRWHSDKVPLTGYSIGASHFSAETALGNLAVMLILTTLPAFPLTFFELILRPRPGKRAKEPLKNDRPAWAK